MKRFPNTGFRVNRRRLIKLCAAGVAGFSLQPAMALATPVLHRWTGVALGARAEINLLHDDKAKARELFQVVEAEIRRLENIFSLYQDDSELVRLNKTGQLTAPSLDMLKLLGTVRQVHDLTNGAFDPTVQPLWAYYAEGGHDAESFEQALARTGFDSVGIETSQIVFLRPGMAMTLNGIAQGYITDQVTELLKSRGCTDIVVDLGEVAVSGALSPMEPGGWPVTLRPDPSMEQAQIKVQLKDRAVASSARQGMTFGADGQTSHILDPRTGLPVLGELRAASVVSKTAAFADGLSTAALVSGEVELKKSLRQFLGTKAFVVRETGQTVWLDT